MENKIAVVRLRGSAKMPKEIRDTFNMLRLKKINSATVLEKNERNMGMIRKIENFIAWGETSRDSVPGGLHPPRHGFRSVKAHYPKGDLGYRGNAIDELIERMLTDQGK